MPKKTKRSVSGHFTKQNRKRLVRLPARQTVQLLVISDVVGEILPKWLVAFEILDTNRITFLLVILNRRRLKKIHICTLKTFQEGI